MERAKREKWGSTMVVKFMKEISDYENATFIKHDELISVICKICAKNMHSMCEIHVKHMQNICKYTSQFRNVTLFQQNFRSISLVQKIYNQLVGFSEKIKVISHNYELACRPLDRLSKLSQQIRNACALCLSNIFHKKNPIKELFLIRALGYGFNM